MQGIGNRLVRLVLGSPFHGIISGFLMLLTYRGRRSGAEYTLPVGYHDDGSGVTVLVGRAADRSWWRNLRGGAPVRLRMRGKTVEGHADVVGGAEATRAMGAYFAAVPRAASAFGVATEGGRIGPDALAEARQRIPVVRITRRD
jgi:deazaflavin-dependent oxidoreductase (nitroreductase family)